MARQFGKTVESVCSPFQFALSTRTGADCVGHVVRLMTDADAQATALSTDGIGADAPQRHDGQLAQCPKPQKSLATTNPGQ